MIFLKARSFVRSTCPPPRAPIRKRLIKDLDSCIDDENDTKNEAIHPVESVDSGSTRRRQSKPQRLGWILTPVLCVRSAMKKTAKNSAGRTEANVERCPPRHVQLNGSQTRLGFSGGHLYDSTRKQFAVKGASRLHNLPKRTNCGFSKDLKQKKNHHAANVTNDLLPP